MKFLAEIKKTQQLKRVSNDNEYQVVLVTNNSDIMDLGKLPADTLVEVEINAEKR